MTKELYVSDLHIGLPPDDRLIGLYPIIERVCPDKILCHGDTFHRNEVTLADIYRTKDWRTFKGLAAIIPTEVIKGNHDWDLTPEDISPAKLINPYVDAWGYYHSHWSEYDPICSLPHWWHELWARIVGKGTPYQLLQPKQGNKVYNDACALILASIENEHKYKGYIGGHTHKPLHEWLPDADLDIWNCGDWVDSKSCIVRTDDRLELVQL
jgi:UDP-2,3-diacylglucosamine pyrophosphatase LpxH